MKERRGFRETRTSTPENVFLLHDRTQWKQLCILKKAEKKIGKKKPLQKQSSFYY